MSSSKFISPIEFHKIEDLIPQFYEKGTYPLILILDRITDVRNFGGIVRTASCAGVNAILIPEKECAAINADTIKTSAGALYQVPICRTWNLKNSIEFLKESGLQLVSCTEKTDKDIYLPDFTNPTAIIIGSEENGISPEYLKMSDYKSKIPMSGKIKSLNVSVATSVIVYEALRQRKEIEKL